ncbi:MAG: hypothetical protein ACR2HC_06910 [Thermoleophilaceae bacterium]
MKKELRPFHDHVTCAVCGRTMLKGERAEPYLAQDGARHTVCELCFVRAEHTGWIRESAHGETPVRSPRPQERRPLLGRLRRRTPDVLNGDVDADAPSAYEAPSEADQEPAPEPEPVPPAPRRTQAPRQDPRHVRGVPTTAEVKIERGLELFNASGHQRTVSGLSRSLGAPWATALPDLDAASTVNLVVAWELSWYRYRIDLGDASEPVSLAEKGDEIDGIDESLRAWNTALDSEGRLVIGVAGQ